ncbi:MAG: NADPH:quinone reductase-like Zn-dependent oxidoreductase, partial [Myxococcota bacterium]
KSVLAFNLSYLFAERSMLERATGQLWEWADAGKLTPPGVTRYRLDDVAQAHADLESGKTVGKLVLVP